MPLPDRVIISPDALFHVLEGESVLLNLQNDQYYGLDDVGTQMWTLLAKRGDTQLVVQELLTVYSGQVDEASLRHDLGALIDKLAAVGLITVEPAA